APTDGVYTQLSDDAGLRRSTRRGQELGMVGKSVLHPHQVPIVHETLRPGEAELASARKIVALFEEAEASNVAVLQVNGSFVDPAVVARARELLQVDRPETQRT